MVKFLHDRCYIRPRSVAVVLTLILAIAIAVGALWLIIPPFIEGVLHIKDALLRYLQNGGQNPQLPEWLQHLLQQWIGSLQLEEMLQQDNLLQMVRTSLPHVWNVVQSTANVVVSLASSAFRPTLSGVAAHRLRPLLHRMAQICATLTTLVPRAIIQRRGA